MNIRLGILISLEVEKLEDCKNRSSGKYNK